MFKKICAIASLLVLASSATVYAASAEKFVKKATQAGQFEVTAGELAQQKAQSADVKAFAKMMVEDHTASTKKLEELAAQAGVKAVSAPAGKVTRYTSEMGKLQAAKPDEFDGVYLKTQLDAHERAVKLFKSYATNGDNASIKQYASETLPTLQKHLDQVKKLQSSKGAS